MNRFHSLLVSVSSTLVLVSTFSHSKANADIFVNTVTQFAETESAVLDPIEGPLLDRDSGSLNGFGFLTTESVAGGPGGVAIQAREHFDGAITRANSTIDTIYFRGSHTTDVRTTLAGYTHATQSGLLGPTGTAGFGGGEVEFNTINKTNWHLTGFIESTGSFVSPTNQSTGNVTVAILDSQGVPVFEAFSNSPNGTQRINFDYRGTLEAGEEFSLLQNSFVSLATTTGVAPLEFGTGNWNFQFAFSSVPEPSCATFFLLMTVASVVRRKRSAILS